MFACVLSTQTQRKTKGLELFLTTFSRGQKKNDAIQSIKKMTSFDEDYSLENVSSEASISMTWSMTTNDSISTTTVVTPTVMTTVISTTIATTSATSLSAWLTTSRIQIILYITILLLAVIGNALVILTLIQNRRMRTITNVFLLNLAISDILLGVLCMPITLIGTLLRDFVFGEVMCKLLPYLQGTNSLLKKIKLAHLNLLYVIRNNNHKSLLLVLLLLLLLMYIDEAETGEI